MKALVWHGARDLRLEEVDEPSAPGPDEAILEVSYCGICGTDLHEYNEGPVMIRPGGHPLTGCKPPLTLGHEMAGRIVATGSNVDLAEDTRVAVDPCWRCGTCYWCIRGDYHLCKLGGAVGLASDGALAKYVKVPAVGLTPLSDAIDDQTAALAEPLAVGLHAISQGQVAPGDTVIIQGCGPIGAIVVMMARIAGAGSIVVVEPNPMRRSFAEELGASMVIDPADVDLRRYILDLTSGVGMDKAFECSGVPALVPTLMETVRRGGRMVLVGIGHGTTELNPNRIVFFEREVVGTLGYRHDVANVIQLIEAGRLDPAPLITGVVPLDRAITDGFDTLNADAGKHLKILIDVGGSNGL